MAEINVRLDFSFGPPALRGLLVAGLFFAGALDLASENVNQITSYPAPSGVYTRMITTGNTLVSRDAGTGLAVGPAAAPTGTTKMVVMGGNVGIGTTNPRAALEIAGRVKITGGSPASGRVLVSTDTNGLALWSSSLPQGLNTMGCLWRNTSPVQFGSYACPVGQYMAGINVVYYDPDRSPTDFRLQPYCCSQ